MLSYVLPNVIATFFLAIVSILAIIYYFNLTEISQNTGYLSIIIVAVIGTFVALGVFIFIFFIGRKHMDRSSYEYIDDGSGDVTGSNIGYFPNEGILLSGSTVATIDTTDTPTREGSTRFTNRTPRTPDGRNPYDFSGVSTPDTGVYPSGVVPPTPGPIPKSWTLGSGGTLSTSGTPGAVRDLDLDRSPGRSLARSSSNTATAGNNSTIGSFPRTTDSRRGSISELEEAIMRNTRGLPNLPVDR